MMVPPDFRLLNFGVDDESSFDGLRSMSIGEMDVAPEGVGAEGCGSDCEAELEVTGDGFEADIAASLLCSCERLKA